MLYIMIYVIYCDCYMSCVLFPASEETYVWLDYSCIPQRHRPSQTAAINSLTVYAAKA